MAGAVAVTAYGAVFGISSDLLFAGFAGAFAARVFSNNEKPTSVWPIISAALALVASTLVAGLLGGVLSDHLISYGWIAKPEQARLVAGGVIGMSAQAIVEFLQSLPGIAKDGVAAFVRQKFNGSAPQEGPKNGN
jgi:hypothetical protein